MIARVTGHLEGADELSALIRPEGSGFVHEVLVPAHLAVTMGQRVGGQITLHTLEYLEPLNQGASFVPRLVGFASARDRRFFELLTSVKGLGTRKALKALIDEPAEIARSIAARDTKGLTRMPGVGKRLAETMVAELSGKVEPYLSEAELGGLERTIIGGASLDPESEEAVRALMSLGETRADAERRVARALEAGADSGSAQAILEAAYGVA
jgi:Holliday junction DNA helicase RuvA